MDVLSLAIGSALGALLAGVIVFRQMAAQRDEAKRAFNDSDRERARLEAEVEAAAQRLEDLRADEQRLRDAFTAAGGAALKKNTAQFLELAEQRFGTLLAQSRGEGAKREEAISALVGPIRELLQKHGDAVGEIEKQRVAAYSELRTHVEQIAKSHAKLGTETRRLVTALKRPEQRGRWGEVQLRNAVELAGMSKHCDFDEQVRTDEGRSRPDMVVNLPGGGSIVVDAKVALDAYLDAVSEDADRPTLMEKHGQQVETHVRSLATKKYWQQFDRTPQLVVMFMPLESALVAALETRPDLHAKAMEEHVLIATPTLLVALLRSVAYGWRQEDIAENARQIAKMSRVLHERLAKLIEHLDKVGRSLKTMNVSWNEAMGSLDRRLLPSARKLIEMGVDGREIDAPPVVDIEPRLPDTTIEVKDEARDQLAR